MSGEANYPKKAQQMYADLMGVEAGGSLYTLKRPKPFTIEYSEQISRTSKTDSEKSQDRLFVYLITNRGKEYRIAIDCAENRCAMEHNPENDWETYSTALSGFRYRSPSHPECGKKWEYDGK